MRGFICFQSRLWFGACWLLTVSVWPAETNLVNRAQSEATDFSLEDLMNIPVTSVSKKAEPLSQAPAAIYVISQEDLRRAGVRSIPEALRLAPGLEVGHVDSHWWGISSRGFNDVIANKLLVLMDGRSIYTPLFSGVLWDVQNTMLEDIDRIEVVRGPGATLWGANAVNGVINIITKSAKDTPGVLITGGAGSEERGFGDVRYGGKLGTNTYYRVYTTYSDRGESALTNGLAAGDSSRMAQGGFRIDSSVPGDNQLTLQGDLYQGQANQNWTIGSPSPPFRYTLNDEMRLGGGNVIGRWSHAFSGTSDMKLQLYYDRTEREATIFHEIRDTFDADFQHRLELGRYQEVVWGMGYRLSSDRLRGSYTMNYAPTSRTTQLGSAFVQDTIHLVPDRLHLTLGSKFEHNDFTGFEIQPGARLSWTPNPRNTVWTSVARAVRTPSRIEDDLSSHVVTYTPGGLYPGSPMLVTGGIGSRDMRSEELQSYEVGYRVQPHDRLTFDVAAFYYDYEHLRSLEPGPLTLQTSPTGLYFLRTWQPANNLKGETYGAEIAANWQAASWWRWHVNYTFLEMQLHTAPGSGDTLSEKAEGNDPHHQVSLRSSMDLPAHLELDAGLRYVDSLPNLNLGGYVTADVRLGWRPSQKVELSVVFQNVIDSQHGEFSSSFLPVNATEVKRSVYGQLTLRF